MRAREEGSGGGRRARGRGRGGRCQSGQAPPPNARHRPRAATPAAPTCPARFPRRRSPGAFLRAKRARRQPLLQSPRVRSSRSPATASSARTSHRPVSCQVSGGAEGPPAGAAWAPGPEGKSRDGGVPGRVQLRAAAGRPRSGSSETGSSGAALRAAPRLARFQVLGKPGGGLARRSRGSPWPLGSRGSLDTPHPGGTARPRRLYMLTGPLEVLGLPTGPRSELCKSIHTLSCRELVGQVKMVRRGVRLREF